MILIIICFLLLLLVLWRAHGYQKTMISLSFIGIGGVMSIAIYMIFGQPGLPDFPFHALNSPTSEVYFREVSQQKKIIEALKREPDNVRLWKNLSETYQRINQAKAQSHTDKYIIFLERQLQEASSISKSAHMRHTK